MLIVTLNDYKSPMRKKLNKTIAKPATIIMSETFSNFLYGSLLTPNEKREIVGIDKEEQIVKKSIPSQEENRSNEIRVPIIKTPIISTPIISQNKRDEKQFI